MPLWSPRRSRSELRTAERFLDEVTIDVAGGNGGRGVVSFRREKFVPSGGPDGGDGGAGGNVVLLVDPRLTTLSRFRDRRQFRAPSGVAGGRARRHGAAGEDLVIPVPRGTVVRDPASGQEIADLVGDGERVVVGRGGRGGHGNARFPTPTRQAPHHAELGEPGENRQLYLELRLVADVGLVGLPNAGKSTLLAALTGAHPKIGDYPFTTLQPNLGVLEQEGGHVLVIADVPGLIEGAHRGAGLGIDFLRHVRRTRVLLHLVDTSQGSEAARAALRTIDAELAAFDAELAQRPRLVAFTKVDLPGGGDVVAALGRELPAAHAISAHTGEGLGELVTAVGEATAGVASSPMSTPPAAPTDGKGSAHRVYRHQAEERLSDAKVVVEDGGFRVGGRVVERTVAMTDLDNEEAVRRLQRRFRVAGIDAALEAAGCRRGDTVLIGAAEFIWDPTGEFG